MLEAELDTVEAEVAAVEEPATPVEAFPEVDCVEVTLVMAPALAVVMSGVSPVDPEAPPAPFVESPQPVNSDSPIAEQIKRARIEPAR